MIKTIFIFMAIIFNINYSYAIVLGGSNFTLPSYPEPYCFKPTKPFKPYSFSSQWEIDSYNSQWESYINCIEEYLENANNDIKRIRERQQEAIDEANRE